MEILKEYEVTLDGMDTLGRKMLITVEAYNKKDARIAAKNDMLYLTGFYKISSIKEVK